MSQVPSLTHVVTSDESSTQYNAEICELKARNTELNNIINTQQTQHDEVLYCTH